MLEFRVKKIGNYLDVLFPKLFLEKLKVEDSEISCFTDLNGEGRHRSARDNDILVVQALEAEKIMREDSGLLRDLARR